MENFKTKYVKMMLLSQILYRKRGKMKNEKKAVSGVIETILLILISFSVIAVISGIVIPMVKNNLDKSKMIYELRDYFTIENSQQYTCYDKNTAVPANSFTKLMITRSNNKNIDINAIVVSIRDASGATTRYEITKGGTFTDVEMLTGTPPTTTLILEIPALGGAKTYKFLGIAGEYAKVSAEAQDGTIGEPYESAITPCD